MTKRILRGVSEAVPSFFCDASAPVLNEYTFMEECSCPFCVQAILTIYYPCHSAHKRIITWQLIRTGFLQSDWLIAGPYDTILTIFFNFCIKSSILQVYVVLGLEILKIQSDFYAVLCSDTVTSSKQFLNIRTIYQTMCTSCKKVFLFKKRQ